MASVGYSIEVSVGEDTYLGFLDPDLHFRLQYSPSLYNCGLVFVKYNGTNFDYIYHCYVYNTFINNVADINSYWALISPRECDGSAEIQCATNYTLFQSTSGDSHLQFETQISIYHIILDVSHMNSDDGFSLFFGDSNLYLYDSTSETYQSYINGSLVLLYETPSDSEAYVIRDNYGSIQELKLRYHFYMFSGELLSGLYEIYLQKINRNTQEVLASTTIHIRQYINTPRVAFHEININSFYMIPTFITSTHYTQPGLLSTQYVEAGTIFFFPITFQTEYDYLFIDFSGTLSESFAITFNTNYGIIYLPLLSPSATFAPSFVFLYKDLFDTKLNGTIYSFSFSDSVVLLNIRPIFQYSKTFQVYTQLSQTFSLSHDSQDFQCLLPSLPPSDTLISFVPFHFTYLSKTYYFSTPDTSFDLYMKPTTLKYPHPIIIIINMSILICPLEIEGIITEWKAIPSLPDGLYFEEDGCIKGNVSTLFPLYEGTIIASNPEGYISISISMSSQYITCPTMGEWNEVSVNDQSIHICDNKDPNNELYDGSVNLPCGLFMSIQVDNQINYEEIYIINNHYISLINENNLIGQWKLPIVNCTLKAPYDISYSIPTKLYKDIKYEFIPKYKGTALFWTINPELPDGFSFDESNGHIMGSPLLYIPYTEYKITVYNPTETQSTTITIGFVCYTETCATKDDWIETEVGYYAELPCEYPSIQYGTQKLYCNYNSLHLPTWDSIPIPCQYLPPTNITYSSSIFYFYKNIYQESSPPTYIGLINTFSISPDLPNGLALNTVNGILYGTPKQNYDSNSLYTITASNIDSSSTIQITILITNLKCSSLYPWTESEHSKTVTIPCPDTTNYEGYLSRECLYIPGNPPTSAWSTITSTCQLKLPSSIYYNTNLMNNNITFYINNDVVSFIPSFIGIIDSWSIYPHIMDGLFFSVTSGSISGSLRQQYLPSEYIVTAENKRGSNSFLITIITEISYCEGDDIWPTTEKGQTANIPCDSSEYIGIRSRQCGNSIPAQWEYEINTCVLRSPRNLTYELTNYIFIKGQAFETNNPTYDGYITEFRIVPSLPDGLTIHKTKGYIYGIPTEKRIQTVYTVTGYNKDAFSNSVDLLITVNIIGCPQTSDWPQAEKGQIIYKNCIGGKKGVQYRACLLDNNPEQEGVWDTVNYNECIIVLENEIPPSSYSFVFIPFQLSNIPYMTFEAKHEVYIKQVFLDILFNSFINDYEILVNHVNFESDSLYKYDTAKVYLRIKVLEDDIPALISLLTTNINDQTIITKLIELDEFFKKITSYVEATQISITLYTFWTSQNITITVICCSLAVLILIVIIYYILLHYRRKRLKFFKKQTSFERKQYSNRKYSFDLNGRTRSRSSLERHDLGRKSTVSRHSSDLEEEEEEEV
ncbi:hypothetical protein WA158_003721 [Blastocystis sp. Blastoise]